MDTTSIQCNIASAINDMSDEALAELDVMQLGMAYFPQEELLLDLGGVYRRKLGQSGIHYPVGGQVWARFPGDVARRHGHRL